VSVIFCIRCDHCGAEMPTLPVGWLTCMTHHYCTRPECQRVGRERHASGTSAAPLCLITENGVSRDGA